MGFLCSISDSELAPREGIVWGKRSVILKILMGMKEVGGDRKEIGGGRGYEDDVKKRERRDDNINTITQRSGLPINGDEKRIERKEGMEEGNRGAREERENCSCSQHLVCRWEVTEGESEGGGGKERGMG